MIPAFVPLIWICLTIMALCLVMVVVCIAWIVRELRR